MSQPYDGTIHSRLSALEKLFKETYSDELLEPTYMSGGPSVSMFDFQDESIGGDGMTFKIKRMKSAPTSFSRSALAEFGLADRPYLDSEYKYRFHQTDPSKNDFGRASAAVQVSWYDIKNASKQAMIDLVKENVKDFRDDMKWKKAVARNTGRSCILAYIKGTKKANDGKYMTDCSPYTTATSFRANIDNGTPARFRPGDLCDVVDTSGTVVADRVKVIEDLQHRVQVQREAAVLLAQRIEVLSTKSWSDAQAAQELLSSDVARWQEQAQALSTDASWPSVEARFPPLLDASRAQLLVVWEAFSSALAQAVAAASDEQAPLPPVPVKEILPYWLLILVP